MAATVNSFFIVAKPSLLIKCKLMVFQNIYILQQMGNLIQPKMLTRNNNPRLSTQGKIS